MTVRGTRAALTAALAALALIVPACSRNRKIVLPVVENQRPVVRLTQAPASTSLPYFYAYEVFWTAFDPDGHVDRYLYALDPPTGANAETAWVSTSENRKTLLLRSGDPDTLGTKSNPGGFHVFVLKAMDDRGLASAPVAQAFFSYTVAPTVEFIQPKANHLLQPMVPPSTSFTWTGTDPDGQSTKRPVKYKYRLFSEDNQDFTFLVMLLRPDSLRRYYAPGFAGWDSVSGDTVTVRVSNMIPYKKYVMAVVSFDEAGAYSPVFNYDGNLLYFLCQYTGRQGPQMTVWNEYFSYTYATGGYNPDPTTWVRVEVPFGQRIPFWWTATAQSGANLKSFRWAMDIERLDDETRRTNEATDVTHWSLASASTRSGTVGPFAGASPESLEQHFFYIEAEDDNGLKSLAVIQMKVIRPSFARELLFVDDTRFAPDQSIRSRPDSVLAPGGLWPSAAELDTFLFARGGVRWRYYLPVTQLSPPGIFNGYSFDTLGTRGLPGGLVPLAKLAGYRHVVWYCDPAQTFTEAPTYNRYPMPTLRWISQPGQANTLAIYMKLGGKTWLMGGGIAYNSLLPFNVTSNDVGGTVFSSSAGELAPGRMMYSGPHWESEITLGQPRQAERNTVFRPWPGAPDYSVLPALLLERTTGTDPVPPERGAGTFYQTSYRGEFLSKANQVVEDVDPDPDIYQEGAALDTIYYALGGSVPEGEPIMTYYHGSEVGPVVFSGFPLWYFQRAQAIQVADFVLQGIWGLPRAPVTR
ncbi:MAG: hypothetical protein HZC42_00445 [Candidatus Eisenbacteria bacterium]|nr:hypothetical protein [Candidatus Eisenbacteria bacterium]